MPTLRNYDVALDIRIRTQLHLIMKEIGLPAAQAAASNTSIAASIGIMPVARTSRGRYVTGFTVPSVYMYVERGTGIYVGGSPWTFGPTASHVARSGRKGRRAALMFDIGAETFYAREVTIKGQEGRHFLQKGCAAAGVAWKSWCRSNLLKGLL